MIAKLISDRVVSIFGFKFECCSLAYEDDKYTLGWWKQRRGLRKRYPNHECPECHGRYFKFIGIGRK